MATNIDVMTEQMLFLSALVFTCFQYRISNKYYVCKFYNNFFYIQYLCIYTAVLVGF